MMAWKCSLRNMPVPAVLPPAKTLGKKRHAATSMGDQSFALLTVPKLMESRRHSVTSTVAPPSALLDAKTLENERNAVLSTVALLSALLTV